jgi:FOG: LysM repeat
VDLIKKNIHMNKLKCKSNVQLTLDDDFNVPDIKPDMERIVKEQGNIVINETKPMNGKLMVKGALHFIILYISEEDARPVHNIMGEIPFEEVVNMDDSCAEDNVVVKWDLDDFNVSMINSRKISVKAIVSFIFTAEDIYDEETAVSVEGDESVQFKNKKIDITQIAMSKKDIFRVKDEIMLPSGKPNIYEILYNEVELRGVQAKVFDNKISMKGELLVFVLYTGEDEMQKIQFFETEIPFDGIIECNGCTEDMISNIAVSIQNKDLQIKPDDDGEERIIDMEVILELDIKIYGEEELEILSDIYSVAKEVTPTFQDAFYENLLMKNNSKLRVVDRVLVEPGHPKVLQICNASGNIRLDDQRIVPNGIEVEGIIEIQLLYITEEDNKPLAATKGVIPFAYTVDVKDMKDNSMYEIRPGIDQISVMMLDGEEIEVKVSINLDTIVFDKITEPIITDVKIEDLDLDKLQQMPSVIGYIVKSEDSLWTIAKNFYTTVDSIKELNLLDSDLIKKGDKLLLMKKVDAIL